MTEKPLYLIKTVELATMQGSLMAFKEVITRIDEGYTGRVLLAQLHMYVDGIEKQIEKMAND